MPGQCLSMPRAKILFFRRKKTYLSLFDMRPEQIRLSVLFLFIQGGRGELSDWSLLGFARRRAPRWELLLY